MQLDDLLDFVIGPSFILSRCGDTGHGLHDRGAIPFDTGTHDRGQQLEQRPQLRKNGRRGSAVAQFSANPFQLNDRLG